MYHWVEDKEFLKKAYSECAGIVNQLVQNLKHYDIAAEMKVVGSKSRNMITQNANEPIDFDFNLVIWDAPNMNDCRYIKESARKAFNEVLERNGWDDCADSTSALTTKTYYYKKGNHTEFSIDVCLVKIQGNTWARLIHQKTGWAVCDQYCWEFGRDLSNVFEKEREIKSVPPAWDDVRQTYIDKKNRYLSWNDSNHPSFVCYIEAVNEVYYALKSRGTL